ncbi:MAG: Asp-tRNA(Asn)/Glu-tRNA(Gln) amidotransferase subunit GatC [Candidatus Paceibacterota bacterium]|jgi:aspartyl-tRNA(Asn)/glutamyl-tRNA(Gln) amidotransferase subunit C
MEIKDIEKLAELAKIELTDAEKQGLLKDLDGILDYVRQIESVEVEDIEPEYLNKNVWREDENKPSVFSRDLIINQFPDSKDGFVKVKKIL